MPRPTLRATAVAVAIGAASLTSPAYAAAPRVVGSTATPVTATATTTLNVRSGPGTSYGIIGTLRPGQAVTGTVANGWMRMTSGAFAGRFASAAYLNVVRPTPPGTVTAWMTSEDRRANIRSGPGFGYPVVGRTAIHQRVTGTVVGDWLKIAPNRFVNRGTMTTTSAVSSLNGRLPQSALCPLPLADNTQRSFAPGYTPKTTRYLNCFALHAFNSLESAYKARFGRYAEVDLAYRSYSEQVYWYRRLGPGVAAYPGTSNHGQGIAVDFREDDRPNTFYWGHPGNVWLLQNASRFGFVNLVAWGTPHESYHFDFVG